jgi:hypothetical protein
MRYHLYLILPFYLFITSCKQETKSLEPEVLVSLVEEVLSPTGASSSLPHLVSNADGTLVSWVETKGDSLATLFFSELENGIWQESQAVVEGGDWFVNWADYPMIAENNGNYWSHVLKKSTKGTYSYDVKMNIKPKESANWETDMSLHTDGTPTEHGFVSVLPYKEAFFVTWLDGRNTEKNKVGERGAMTLRAAEVAVNGEVSHENQLDVSTCDCCQTTAAITDNGPVVLYRDRSEEEIRDISIVRQVDGAWTAPKTIYADGWKIKGCPVNGPKAAAMGNNLVAAWFTGAQNTARVQVAFSKDGGEHFLKPIMIAEGTTIGRVDVVWVDEETAVVSWMDTKEKVASLNVAKISKTGVVSDKVTAVEMNGSRQSGFPQLEKVDDMLYFAWTEVTKTDTRVRMAKMAISAL